MCSSFSSLWNGLAFISKSTCRKGLASRQINFLIFLFVFGANARHKWWTVLVIQEFRITVSQGLSRELWAIKGSTEENSCPGSPVERALKYIARGLDVGSSSLAWHQAQRKYDFNYLPCAWSQASSIHTLVVLLLIFFASKVEWTIPQKVCRK